MDKTIKSLCAVAAVAFATGCVSNRAVINNNKEVVKNPDGTISTNVTQTVSIERDYNAFGRVVNATTGTLGGMWNGMVDGYREGTSTNGMENANFWDKTCKFTKGVFGGMGKGAAEGAKEGYNRDYNKDQEAQKQKILEEYNKSKQNSL